MDALMLRRATDNAGANLVRRGRLAGGMTKAPADGGLRQGPRSVWHGDGQDRLSRGRSGLLRLRSAGRT